MQSVGNKEDISMSRTISRETASDDVETFFEVIFTVIPRIVRKACISLGRDPNQMDLDEFAQRVGFLLLKDDYRLLRSFKRESLPETWLFTIVRRSVLRWLREQDVMESLEDRSPNFFIIQQRQEERLLLMERRKILKAASYKLPERKQKLLGFWLQEMSRGETSEEMGIKRRSVSVEKAELIKMLRRLIREDCAI
jgi:RNA polymerase sigma factor (sigma-70 family)